LIRPADPADHQLIDNEPAHARSSDGEAPDRCASDDHRADGEGA
jgi:hypothetical protein